MIAAGTGDTKLGIAWVALCLAFALHIVDEASTGFLSVYNPTVLAMRERAARPMPGFYSSPGLLAASIYKLFRLLV